MSKDPPSKGPRTSDALSTASKPASPTVVASSTSGASSSSTKPPSTGVPATGPKPGKPRTSIFERVRAVAQRASLAAAGSSSLPAGAGPSAVAASKPSTSPAALAHPFPSGARPTSPVVPPPVKPAEASPLASSRPSVAAAAPAASAGTSKRVEEAEEAAIDHALFSHPPPPPPARAAAAQLPAARPPKAPATQGGGAPPKPTSPLSFKRKVPAPDASSSPGKVSSVSAARLGIVSGASSSSGAAPPGPKPGVIDANTLLSVYKNASRPLVASSGPSSSRPAASNSGAPPPPPKMKQSFRRINPATPLGPPGAPAGLASSSSVKPTLTTSLRESRPSIVIATAGLGPPSGEAPSSSLSPTPKVPNATPTPKPPSSSPTVNVPSIDSGLATTAVVAPSIASVVLSASLAPSTQPAAPSSSSMSDGARPVSVQTSADPTHQAATAAPTKPDPKSSGAPLDASASLAGPTQAPAPTMLKPTVPAPSKAVTAASTPRTPSETTPSSHSPVPRPSPNAPPPTARGVTPPLLRLPKAAGDEPESEGDASLASTGGRRASSWRGLGADTAVESKGHSPLAGFASKRQAVSKSATPPDPAATGDERAERSPAPGSFKKRARAVLSDSDSEPAEILAHPAHKKERTAPSSPPAPSTLSEPPLASHPPAVARSTPSVAVQAPTWATVVDWDEDDVPLGFIINKASSPSVSPQPPSSAERTAASDQAPKASTAQAPLRPPAPSSASRLPTLNLPLSQPMSSLSPSGPETPVQGLFAAEKDARLISPSQPAAAPTAPSPVAPPIKNEPIYVGSDLGSDDDDDIIFVAERPPGHKLILPGQGQPASAAAPEPALAVGPRCEPESATAERIRSRPPKRVMRHESPPSSDPLNIQDGKHSTRTPSPVVEKTPHSVHISPRKRRLTRTSLSEVEEPASSKKQRTVTSRVRQSPAKDTSDHSPSDLESEDGQSNENSDDENEEEEEEDDEVLRMHRAWCEKCQQAPADELLATLEKKRKRGGRKKKATSSDDDIMSDGEEIEQMGGWIECQRCCVASHFGCLSAEQRSNLLKQVSRDTGVKKLAVEIGESSSFVCGGCAKNPACFCCGSSEMQEQLDKTAGDDAAHKDAAAPATSSASATSSADAQKMNVDETGPAVGATSTTSMDVDEPTTAPAGKEPTPAGSDGFSPILFYRCFRCKRGVHYSHLQKPRGMKKASTPQVAEYYQEADWSCHDCLRWVFDVDKVIAWRPSPADAVEEPLPVGVAADYRKQLPREYLVKWSQLGFRHVEWVPHQWLLANSKQRLRNFLHSGSDLAPFLSQLFKDAAEDPVVEDGGSVAQLLELNSGAELDPGASQIPTGTAIFTAVGPPAADPIADSRIPTAWKTVDRVLSVWMKQPSKRSLAKRGRGGKRVYDRDIDAEDIVDLEPGLRPDDSLMVDVDEWQAITGLELDERASEQVIWAYIKWEDLPYKMSTYDTPPSATDVHARAAFKRAWKTYTQGLKTIIPVLTKSEIAAREAKRKFQNVRTQPSCVVGGTLMDFQMQGLNWLYSQWCKSMPCILADDMGLGKTVQIAALVGLLTNKHYYPSLIVVPNSTISNWMREFEKWIPDVRVAPYHGEKASRDIVEAYELFHGEGTGGRNRGLKVHCVITTYEAVTHKSFNDVFRRVPRWEMLVADEGQRLKNDASKIVKSLATLNTAHRILLTGTPLNNNIRELFNLMNFLDPDNWDNLDELTREYESVNSDNLAALRDRLKPYFLRRVKADVLKLPPKHEVIVPIFMRSLQREVYKGLMLSNAELIKNLVGGIQQQNEKHSAKVMKATNLSNLMMQLRKACAHPYLNQADIEDKSVGRDEMHKRLTEASAKLSFLKLLLPKLFQKGHRVLLFSGFVIALDILSDWLDGEGIPFFRLDGSTPQAQRQKDIDAFNAPSATTNLFILSTRAGGVGINLATADTVVMFDADFNPHQDIQAIARAYRFGQTKKVIVFKLMIRNSVEEKILEKGKRKMVLDHLIIQDMAREEDTDVGSLIAFGAKALFAEEEAAVKHYSSEDVEGIIQRAETAEDASEAEASGMKFDYAEIYDGAKDSTDQPEGDNGDDDFWDAIVKRATKEKEEREEAGRSARRSKKTTYAELIDSPPPLGKRPLPRVGSPEYDPAAAESSASDDSEFEPERSHRRRSPAVEIEGSGPPAGDKAALTAPSKSRLSSTTQNLPTATEQAAASGSRSGPNLEKTRSYAELERAVLAVAGHVNIDVAPILQTIQLPRTTPDKRKELWDLAINLLGAHLEIRGLTSSLQLQPLLRGKAVAHDHLASLPYHPDGVPPAAQRHQTSSNGISTSKPPSGSSTTTGNPSQPSRP